MQPSIRHCSSSDATANQTASVIGYEPITIAGTTVNTIHVHVDVALTGTSQGTSPADYWFTTDGSRLVKNTGSVDSTQSGPFGTVHYNEVYALQLVSLQPQR